MIKIVCKNQSLDLEGLFLYIVYFSIKFNCDRPISLTLNSATYLTTITEEPVDPCWWDINCSVT